jgi:hypothetical protein
MYGKLGNWLKPMAHRLFKDIEATWISGSQG